jgi:hypothetical protein
LLPDTSRTPLRLGDLAVRVGDVGLRAGRFDRETRQTPLADAATAGDLSRADRRQPRGTYPTRVGDDEGRWSDRIRRAGEKYETSRRARNVKDGPADPLLSSDASRLEVHDDEPERRRTTQELAHERYDLVRRRPREPADVSSEAYRSGAPAQRRQRHEVE